MPEVLNLTLYDDIGPEVVKGIAEQLLANPNADVVLHINSPGGSVTDGYAVANALKTHQGHKIAVVEGLCASAATFPACACDEVHMHPESLFMVHGPWGEAVGGPEAMTAQGDLLGKMADLCSVMYQRKTGADEAQVREWMASDNWMKPADAMEAGFCDKILTAGPPPMARAAAQHYLARLRRPAQNKEKRNMAKSYEGVIPENLAKKLCGHGLAMDDEMSPEMIRKAHQAYMEETTDEPEMRREMSRAVMGLIEKVEGDQDEGNRLDNPSTTDGNAKAKADDEEESSADKTEKMRAKLIADAKLDPATAKLVDALTNSQAKMEKKVADLKTEARARAVADYQTFAKKHVSQKDADEYLELADGNIARAQALVAKHPEKTKTMQRFTQAGRPIGAAPASASDSEPAPTVNAGGRNAVLHGYALSAQARAKFSADKPPTFDELAKAQRAVAKTRPDLFA